MATIKISFERVVVPAQYEKIVSSVTIEETVPDGLSEDDLRRIIDQKQVLAESCVNNEIAVTFRDNYGGGRGR